jgi:sporulation protein YlmC with PRC-barrel domain
MALYANLRDYKFSEEVEDIRGSDIYAANGDKLGTIDDVIFDHSTGDMRYLVVDTGGWLSSKRFMLPAREVMTQVEGDERGYRVALTKQQIERFPEFKEEAIDRDEDFSDYERRYQESYHFGSGSVLHREGSVNTITPTPEEMPDTASRGRTPSVGSPRRIATDMPRFGGASDNENSTDYTKAGYDMRPLQPTGSLAPRDRYAAEESEREESEIEANERQADMAEPATMNRSEFLKDGTLRSEYDAPREDRFLDRETRPAAASVASDADINGYAPDGGNRFRKFQERLRHEREEILRRRDERRAA